MSIIQIIVGAIVSSGAGGGGGGYPIMGSGSYISNVGAAAGGVQGTAYDPGGGVPNVLNNVNSWAYYIKDGQFEAPGPSGQDINFFNGVTKTGEDVYGGFGDQAKAAEYYAIQWLGYIYVTNTGDYNINLESDDLLYFWIGTNALAGNFTFNNSHVNMNNNGGYNTNSVTLTGGLYYPIRMWFQEWSGNENAQVFMGSVASAALAMNQWSLYYNSQTGGHNDTPTYELQLGGGSAVDEGSAQTFYVSGTNVIGGTYYWTIETGSEDFTTTSGEVTVSDGTGSTLGTFTVTPTADATTEGEQSFTVALRSVSITGTILATSPTVIINDTSQTPAATYTWGIYDTSGDEGDQLTFNVDTTNVADGTTLYWNVILANTISSGDFTATSGSFAINSNTGTFTIDLASDGLTEGNEPFTVQVRTVSNSGTVVLTSNQITIGDTSSGARAPIAYIFNGTGSSIQLQGIYSDITIPTYTNTTGVNILKGSYPEPQAGWLFREFPADNWSTINSVSDSGIYWTLNFSNTRSGGGYTSGQLGDTSNSDWALGTTWTIEFWVKPTVVPGRNGAPNDAQRILSVNTNLNVQSNFGYNNLDICFTQGIIAIANQFAGFDAPAEMVGVWSHVAISSVDGLVSCFINGAKVYEAGWGINFANGADDLYIGVNGTRTSANVNSFDGLLTDIRISNIARYTSAFNPATTLAPTRDVNTKLLLTPKQDSWLGSETVHRLGYSIQVTVDYPTPPTYTVNYVGPNNVNEGSDKEFAVTGTNIPNGTYYWTVTNSGDFATASGEFTITSNSGSFSVTPTADVTTEGAETFTAQVRSGSISGVVLATSSTVTINDTSLAPPPPYSLQFVQSQTDYLDVAASNDWSLGTTWTIEWWNKSAKVSSGGDLLTVMCQNFTTSGIQILYQNGFQIQGSTVIAPEPVPGVWTHVALISDGSNLKLYYNGVGVYTGSAWNLNNTTDAIRIGARGTATFQRFDGELAMIRISNVAKYATTFTPTLNYGVESDTKLFLGSDTPFVDTSASPKTITNTGVTISTNYPSVVGAQSLMVNQPDGDFMSTPASADWNLGTTWTMEFWMNANNASSAGINIPGGQWGLLNQGGWYGGIPNNSILIGLAGGYLTVAQDTGTDIQFAEPTAGQWTHVAVVNNGGGTGQKVYYNGVEQTKTSGTYQSNGWTNTTADLYIGRLSNQYAGYASHFDGKMAMIRISNAAKYTAAFTASTTYGVEADTKLFLGSTVPWVDTSVSPHFITNNGVGISTSFPT